MRPLCFDQGAPRLLQLASQLVDQHLLLTTQSHLALAITRPQHILLLFTPTHILTFNLLALTLLTQFLLTTNRQRLASVCQPPQFVATLIRRTCPTLLLFLLLISR